MKKSVAIINDELGTIALGFSKSGYEIGAIYIDYSDRNAITICQSNWGDRVCCVNWDNCTVADFIDTDFIAGKIPNPGFSIAGRNNVKKNDCILTIVDLLREKRPSAFLFQWKRNRSGVKKEPYEYFYKNVIEMGYQIRFDTIDIRLITGLPVNEREFFVYGTLNSNSLTLEALKDLYTDNYSIADFCETKHYEDEWYYHIDSKFIHGIERESNPTVLCWGQDHYKESKYISWNPRMVPLIVQGKEVRKITHKEIARLKGIPDEYDLEVKNRTWLYQNLMYCANVQVIKKIVSAISYDMGEKSFQRRAVSKGIQFENIIETYFENKNIIMVSSSEKNDIINFHLETGIGVCFVVLKIYSSNVGIEKKLLTECERLLNNRQENSENCIFIVGNIVGEEFKEKVRENYKIHIWDVKNLLWLFDEFPQIKSEFMSLLSYTISDVIPQKPEPDIFEQKPRKLYNIDLQEKLRKIRPGKDDAQKYEKLCIEILRYIFSEDMEFFEEQEKSNDGLYRFDYWGKIKHGNLNEFSDTIQNFFRTKYIVFEFKNYSSEITQKEIYTTEKYLYEKALRKVAVIISRKGADTNAQKAARGCLRENGKLIICLSDEDINRLIDIKSSLGIPGDMLEEILDDMLKTLEK